MNLLILGGTGAMGVSLVSILAAQGHDVHVTSRSYHGEENPYIHYLQGDAHNEKFLHDTLSLAHYDAVVDFMIYTTAELNSRLDALLTATDQYIFLSSSRVYADSETPLTEDSPRLLDVVLDAEYMKTEEYALTKARQENLLLRSGYMNWTIVRPYITYNTERLQLGIYEKETWLFRALNNHTIVFPKDIAEKYTTLTYGADVAMVMAKLIGNKAALGEAIHIASGQKIRWNDVLTIYQDVIEDNIKVRPKVLYVEDSKEISEIKGCQYQTKYDRLFNRSFDSAKADRLCVEQNAYTSLEEGLSKCLNAFLYGEQNFRGVSWKEQAYMDMMTHERTPLCIIPSIKEELKYWICRYTPYLMVTNR